MQIELSDLSEVDDVAKSILKYADKLKIWVFEGDMGAGKTTLIKAVCKQFNIHDDTSSPTFSLVNVYEDDQSNEYYHFDFYRIENEMEALDIGSDEYFYSGNYCFIEWAENVPLLIPSQNLKISINLDAESKRIISLSKHE